MTRPLAVSSAATPATQGLVLRILFSVSFVHLLNDCVQAELPSLYPMLKAQFGLSFTQIGLITLTFQCTASLSSAGCSASAASAEVQARPGGQLLQVARIGELGGGVQFRRVGTPCPRRTVAACPLTPVTPWLP